MLRSITTVAIMFWGLYSVAQTDTIQYDHDDRPTPQMLFNPEFTPVSHRKDLNPAKTYLQQNWSKFGLAKQAGNIVFKTVRQSLLGRHYTFVQKLNGYEIEGAKIIVSVDRNGDIYRVTNNTYPNAKAGTPALKNTMDGDSAMLTGWEYLSVRGKLMDTPEAELCYLYKNGAFHLVYRVKIEVNDPMGDWRMAIDAVTGDILETTNHHISHKNGQGQPAPQTPPEFDGRISDFGEALTAWKARQREERELREKAGAKKEDGRGMIFDPDPRTTLLDDTLLDTSPPSRFAGAYLERPLRDITVENGNYTLSGPYVQMMNLDSPNTQPTATQDGFWNFTRGNFGLNEAIAYYHIDQSQREIQALGYSGPTGLQDGPVRVDVNALNGSDNSIFSSPNDLLFGAGCVDDSEDADVILHEYGHAIQYAINPDFFFNAHEGAMGEGFGDYWASSYSISRPNGYEFFPSRMFSWDGQFDCWNGRRTDKFDMQYQHSRATYDAHEPVPGGISDELWSTPLFQSLLELYRQGIPREEVNRIIIEAQFGLGVNQKMRLVAEAIVQTASMLHPDGPHAQVFREYFANHGILDPASTFTYVSAHVPPNRAENDWKSEILITNPNNDTANVGIIVYEADENGNFLAQPAQDLAIAPGDTETFVPGGTNQRWVEFTSDQPLAGTTFFMRRPSDAVGTEKAGIPLQGQTELAQSLILPHIPADRASFWSGAVLLNPGDAAVNLDIELIGTNGSDLSNLLNANVPTQLAPRQKLVTFISEGPGGIPGIFDDSGSEEKVSWVRINGSGELGAFELFGYNSNTGAVASSGIVALPDQNRNLFPIRVATTNTDFSSLSILNPLDETVEASVKVYGNANQLLMSKSYLLPGKTKQLGLNLQGGNFNFPIGHPDAINIQGSNVTWMTVEANAPLRVFELAGDTPRTTLDGAAVAGTTTRVVFQKPAGILQILQGMHSGTVTIQTNLSAGPQVEDQEFNLVAGASLNLEVPDGTESLIVSGALFSANVVDRDFDSGSLTIVKGTQVQLGQSQGKFSVEFNDDHSNDFGQATELALNQTSSGSLDYSGDRDVFKLDVPSDGTLNTYTTGNTDTFGTLYNNLEQEVDVVDDIGGGNLNFGITRSVTTGVYYVAVSGFQDTTGRYTLHAEFTASNGAKTDVTLTPVGKWRENRIESSDSQRQ